MKLEVDLECHSIIKVLISLKEAAKNLDFETAAILRDELKELQKIVDGKADKKDK